MYVRSFIPANLIVESISKLQFFLILAPRKTGFVVPGFYFHSMLSDWLIFIIPLCSLKLG